MAWSKYQNDIFDYATSLDAGSFAINAVAGSGKTTTEIECARRIAAKYPEETILFLAFNKSIVEELKERTKEFPGIRCNTLHSLGMGILYRSKLTLNLNDSKYKNYIKDNYKKLCNKPVTDEPKKMWLFVRNCDELLRLSRINLIKSGDMNGIKEVAFHHNISPVANEFDAVSKLLLKSQTLTAFKSAGKKGYDIDYTDMICLPLTESFSKFIFKYDTVFIDEAQDLNLAQQELMQMSIKPGGRFICAGDPGQSIIGFGGASNDSFKRLETLAGKTLPLSVNYRCGTTIINEAKKLVPQIEAHEGASEGVIEHVKDLSSAQPGDMVLCRKTAPLLEVALNMMANGKSANIKGKDIAEKMKMLIDRVDTDKNLALTLDVLYNRLDEVLIKLIADLRERKVEFIQAHPQYIDMVDKINAIKQIGSRCSSPGELRELLDKLFVDAITGNAVMLSTVHKAKGLEADNVFIICPELLPMRMDGQLPWELEQEMNLKYVAITRAKKRLVWVDVDEKNVGSMRVV